MFLDNLIFTQLAPSRGSDRLPLAPDFSRPTESPFLGLSNSPFRDVMWNLGSVFFREKTWRWKHIYIYITYYMYVHIGYTYIHIYIYIRIYTYVSYWHVFYIQYIWMSQSQLHILNLLPVNWREKSSTTTFRTWKPICQSSQGTSTHLRRVKKWSQTDPFFWCIFLASHVSFLGVLNLAN